MSWGIMQFPNMTDPKPPLWRKWGRKECLMRCVVITAEGASLPRLQPATQRAPFSHSALTGSQLETRREPGRGPWVSWMTWPQSCKIQMLGGRAFQEVQMLTMICLSTKSRALEKHRIKWMHAGKKIGSILQDPLHQPGEIIPPWKLTE